MASLSLKNLFSILFIAFIGFFVASVLSAWTGPTGSAPTNNSSTPINVGTTDQVKNAGLSVNALTVFGSEYVQSKLGVGVVSPVVAIETSGTIRIGSGGETCQSVTAGAIQYASSTKKLQYCNGTMWHTLAVAQGATQTIYLTSGTSWSVPSTWDPSSNTIEVIGAGSGANRGANGGGGGAGGYSKVTNVSLPAGSTITYSVGAAGGTNGGDTYLCNSTSNCTSLADSAVVVGAQGARVDAGGQASSGVGSTKYSGGNGGILNGVCASSGGGGAAGPNGNGANGGASNTGCGAGPGEPNNWSRSGAGGGGNGGGSPGGDAGYTYGAGGGGNGTSGTTGGTGSGYYGSGGGSNGGGCGGGSGYYGGDPGGAGGNGAEWDSSHGSGAGGGGGGNWPGGYFNGVGGNGGLYGGGGGGSVNAASSAGGQGIIVITYTPAL